MTQSDARVDLVPLIEIARAAGESEPRWALLSEGVRQVAAGKGLAIESVMRDVAALGADLEIAMPKRGASHEVRTAFEAQAARLHDPDVLGDLYETLRANESDRRARGRWFTRRAVVDRVIAKVASMRGDRSVDSVLDPAMGSGRFLLAARRMWPRAELAGIDIDPWATFVARCVLYLDGEHDVTRLIERLRCADTLASLPRAPIADVVVGNPPWVAYQGRQAVKLTEAVRARYRATYHSFRGFATLHGMFVEWAARAVREGGVLALLVPTQMADLDGYRFAREAVTARLTIEGPLDELGFDQFDGVTEPTVILCARRLDGIEGASSGAPWPMHEKAGDAVNPISPAMIAALAPLASLPRFPAETFGEAGFQTAGKLAQTHLAAWPSDDPRFDVALREGSDVHAYVAGPASRALRVDAAEFARVRTRYRPEIYPRVAVLIRQTARYPIAAVHDERLGFRNSLLAGYSDEPHTLVALLNSTLLRAFHLSSQRDGRQAVFPQLKVAHLRALPAPPDGADLSMLAEHARVAAAAQRTRLATIVELRAVMDASRVSSPRGGYGPDADARARVWDGVFASRVRSEATAGVIRAALARMEAAMTAFDDAQRAVDRAVFAAYRVDPGAFAGLVL